MTTRDSKAILQAILDEPEDDLHRLAFADWLEENGQDERAEFIRVQIQLHKRLDCHLCARIAGTTPWRCINCTRLKRQATAVFAHAPDAGKWLTGYEAFPSIEWHVSWSPIGVRHRAKPQDNLFEFSRGFCCKATCTHDAWLAHSKVICKAHPIEKIELSDTAPSQLGVNFKVSRTAPLYSWCTEHAARFCGEISPEIHKHLEGFTQYPGNSPDWKDYETEEAAIAALSAACIRYGRSK